MDPPPVRSAEAPARPPRLLLLGRPGCGLCDEMAEEVLVALDGRPVPFGLADVDDDPDRRRRYGLRIPVLLDQWNEVICEGRFDAGAFGIFLARL